MTKPRFRAVAIVLVCLALAGGAWWWTQRPIVSGDLTLQGNVEVRQVNLGFKVAGRIASLAVDEGDAITERQPLGTLDRVYFEDAIAQLAAQRDQLKASFEKFSTGNRPEEIAQAEAAVAEREAMYANAKIAFERAEQLDKTGAGTRKTYDDAQAALRQTAAQLNSAQQALNLIRAGYRKEDIEAARAQLNNAEAALKVAERQLADAVLYAPNNGVILTRVRETGAIVNAGETVFVLSLTTPVWVRSYVSELDLSRIKPGQEVSIRTDSPNVPLMKGRVGFISTTAEFTPKTVETRELRTALVYRVRIVVDDAAGVLRQGMPVTLTLLPATANDTRVSGKTP